MKKLLALLLCGVALIPAGVAWAQINTVPQVGLITSVLKFSTFSSQMIIPAAVNPTDVACINGAVLRSISLKRVQVSAQNNGGYVNVPVSLIHHFILDTGGTTQTTPGITGFTVANPISPATASIVAYTANPTINDANPGSIRTQLLTAGSNITSANIPSTPLIWTFGENDTSWFAYAPDIVKSATGQWCINLNNVSTTSLYIDIEWTES